MAAAKVLRRRTVLKGRIFNIDREDVRLPNGRVVCMEVVRHRGSVVLVPQPSATSVILIRQYRHVIGRWIWELPAGSLEKGEAPRRAARRECEEEIGLTPRRIERLGMFYPTPGFCDERMVFYRCSDLVPPSGPVEQDEDEQIRPRTFTLAEAWRLVDRGGVIDMKTILGLDLISSFRQPRALRRRPSGLPR
jgi:ADP-ribose pyrophosphatase